MKLSALLFDMDGLMVDTEKLYFEVEREIAARYGKTLTNEMLFAAMGQSPMDSCRILVSAAGIPLSGEAFLEIRKPLMLEKMKTELQPMSGLFEILREFRGKVKMAVVTGAPREYLNITLEKLKLHDFFDVFVCSDEVSHGKPSPEIYKLALQKLSFQASEAVVLEDSSNGCFSGKSAGCFVIAVPDEFTKNQDFSAADFTAKNLIEAKDFIKEEFSF